MKNFKIFQIVTSWFFTMTKYTYNIWWNFFFDFHTKTNWKSNKKWPSYELLFIYASSKNEFFIHKIRFCGCMTNFANTKFILKKLSKNTLFRSIRPAMSNISPGKYIKFLFVAVLLCGEFYTFILIFLLIKIIW